MKKIKLLYITNGINGSGGLERVLSIKATSLVEKLNYDVHILVLNNGAESPFYKFSKKIKFHSITVKGNAFSYIYKYRKGIKKYINEYNPDIISVCDDGLKGLLFPLIIKKNKPTIYERHVSKKIEIVSDKLSYLERLKLYFKYKFMNFGGKHFDHFIVLTKSSIKEWHLDNISVIPNPLPFYPKEFSNLSNKKILSVGKQSYQKGYDRLLEIWKEVSPRFPDWSIEVYGKLNPDLGLEKKAKEYGIAETINFYPPEKNISEKYKQASIFLLTSRFEGFGMVLIEAMAYGVPCISFDCPNGPSDIITSTNGILIKNGDINTYIKSLIKLINEYQTRINLSSGAKQSVEKYKVDNIMKQWDKLFNNLLENHNNIIKK